MCQSQGGSQGNKPGVLGVFIAAALIVVLITQTGAVKNHPLLGKGKGKQPTLAGILGGALPKIKLGSPFSQFAPKGKGGYACPVQGGVKFSDTWGASRSNGRRRHKGVDMFAKSGTKLVAVTKGRVVRAGWNSLGGLGVTIRDKRGTEFYYAHNSHNAVRRGDPVKRGQLIGRVGNTGNARHTPSHVHFEVRPHGRPVNPTGYVRAWC